MPTPPAFVVSSERSGSTLLRYLLDTHPQIASPGELNLGQLCAHLNLVLSRTRPADPDPGAALREVRRIVSEIMEAYLQRNRKTVWCEKSPGNAPFLAILARTFPDARFLCLYRNCRDAAYSCYASLPHGVMPEHARYVSRYPESFPLAMIENWIDKNELILAFERQHPSRCLRVRYEDLVTSPDVEMARVTRFLGVAWDPAILQRAFQVAHSPGGGDTKVRQETSVHTRSIGLGGQMPLTAVSPATITRANELLTALNYAPLRREGASPSAGTAAAAPP